MAEKLSDKQKAAIHLLISNGEEECAFVKEDRLRKYSKFKFENNQKKLKDVFDEMKLIEEKARELEHQYISLNTESSTYVTMMSENIEDDEVAIFSKKYDELAEIKDEKN